MFRTAVCITTALVMAGTLVAASAQSSPPTTPAPSRLKLTKERLKEMRAHWLENRGKLKACRAEVKSKGLAGDDRWFFIEDCMAKS